jgi:nicotinamide riboside transporter PnuC
VNFIYKKRKYEQTRSIINGINSEVNNTLVFFLKDVGYYFWEEATHNKNNLIKVGNIFGVKNTICPF